MHNVLSLDNDCMIAMCWQKSWVLDNGEQCFQFSAHHMCSNISHVGAGLGGTVSSKCRYLISPWILDSLMGVLGTSPGTKCGVVRASLLKLGADQPWDQPKIGRTSIGKSEASQNQGSKPSGFQSDDAAKIAGGFWGNVCVGTSFVLRRLEFNLGQNVCKNIQII